MILYGVRSATALSDTRFYYPLARTNLRLTPVQLTTIGSQAWNLDPAPDKVLPNTSRLSKTVARTARRCRNHNDQILKVLTIAISQQSTEANQGYAIHFFFHHPWQS